MALHLAFGLNNAVPENATAAWGCRAIVYQDGVVDVVHDRQDLQGTDAGKAHLKEWINAGPFAAWQKKAQQLLQDYEMQTRAAKLFVLFEDERGIIVGNTNASAGYLYVAAWMKPPPYHVGSISHGTLLMRDLIPCFLSWLDQLREERGTTDDEDTLAEIRSRLDHQHAHDAGDAKDCTVVGCKHMGLDTDGYFTSEEASEDLAWLEDALNEVAPKGTYFGAHEGDGADFGFWPCEDDEEEGEGDALDCTGFTVNKRELATVLCALRAWQDNRLRRGEIPVRFRDFFAGKDLTPLDADEIDVLCQYLNLGVRP